MKRKIERLTASCDVVQAQTALTADVFGLEQPSAHHYRTNKRLQNMCVRSTGNNPAACFFGQVIETAAVPVIKILADPVSNGNGQFMFDDSRNGRDGWLGGGSGLDYIPLDISFESPQHG